MNKLLLFVAFLFLVFLIKQEFFQFPQNQLLKNIAEMQKAEKENKINPFSQPEYNYNNWKEKYYAMCSEYNHSTKINPHSTYQQSNYDMIMNAKINNELIQTQGLVYKFGQCVENENSGCNCPDSSFTFVEDMSFVLKDAPKKPGCIQLTQSPYCYSLDGVIYQPDIYRLSTEQ